MELTPKQIVFELDRYIVGQDEAKKSVAIALRNRYRRSLLPEELKEEITPKNIIMKGPTGVGKTEIARRLAKLIKAPFIKVEATKYTEVGYVGRDVESMVRDLVEAAIRIVRDDRISVVMPKVKEIAERKICDALLPIRKKANPDKSDAEIREETMQDIAAGRLDKIPVEIEVDETNKPLQLGAMGGGNDNNIGEFFSGLMPKKKIKRRVTVREAIDIVSQQEASKLIDNDSIASEAIKRAEQDGIIFIDELDKIAGKNNTSGPDVSREGVQRDILPIVEGSTVNTKYGPIKTDYILFIAAGAFHVSKVSDLIPELQGRFPIQVELKSLTEQDFIRILREPDNAILRQYTELLKVDKINLNFTDDAINEIARIAASENENSENIGARRLHTVMELLLEEISFTANGDHDVIDINIDKDYVLSHLEKIARIRNLKKYIL